MSKFDNCQLSSMSAAASTITNIKMKKICMSFNNPSIYREAIYRKIDSEFYCDWYFDDMNSSIKRFDVSCLHRVKELQRRQLGPFYWVQGLLKLLFKNYDIYFVLGATGNVSLFVFLIIKKIFFRKKRVYFWTHGFYGKEGKTEMIFWKKPLFSLADASFCYGNHARDLMIKAGLPANKLYVIYNSLNYDLQLKLRNMVNETDIFKKHFGNDYPVLIMIGRLTYRKHLDFLIYAMDKLRRRGHIYNTVIVGKGECESELRGLCNKLGMNNCVWFYGACYNEEENANLLYNSDLCVVPGDIGLTAIHSMMFGCPCISHDNFNIQGPEFEAIIPNKTGTFYRYKDIDSLAVSISEWFNNNNKRSEIRSNCYKEVDTKWNPNNQMGIIKKYLV